MRMCWAGSDQVFRGCAQVYMPSIELVPGDYTVDAQEWQFVQCMRTGQCYAVGDAGPDLSYAYAGLSDMLHTRHFNTNTSSGRPRVLSTKHKIRFLGVHLYVWEKRGAFPLSFFIIMLSSSSSLGGDGDGFGRLWERQLHPPAHHPIPHTGAARHCRTSARGVFGESHLPLSQHLVEARPCVEQGRAGGSRLLLLLFFFVPRLRPQDTRSQEEEAPVTCGDFSSSSSPTTRRGRGGGAQRRAL
jgi:hypothetical protein